MIYYKVVLSSKDFYLYPIKNFILSFVHFVCIAQDIRTIYSVSYRLDIYSGAFSHEAGKTLLD